MPKIPPIKKVEQPTFKKVYFLFDSDAIVEEGNLFTGLLWGTLLSIPLWISIVGLGMLFINVIS